MRIKFHLLDAAGRIVGAIFGGQGYLSKVGRGALGPNKPGLLLDF